MITINFYKDGACIKGHDIDEICTLVSYSLWSCIKDCLKENSNMHYYQSCNDKEWSSLGLTYIKIDEQHAEHIKIFERFKSNLTYWIKDQFTNRVEIYNHDNTIDWQRALSNAKNEITDLKL